MPKLKIVQKEQPEDVVELWLDQDNDGNVRVMSKKNDLLQTEIIFRSSDMTKFTTIDSNNFVKCK